tara:strand:+ start:382 stop:927 length:546 start_codon:yes stop_codon:yes gene_type:complete
MSNEPKLFKVGDFQYRTKKHSHDSWKNPEKMFFYRKLVKKHHSGDWECAAKTFEAEGHLTSAGLTDMLRTYADTQDFQDYADKHYKGNIDKAYGYVSKKISSQYVKKFKQIYKFNNPGNQTTILDRVNSTDMTVKETRNLNAAFNIESTLSKSELLNIASQVSNLVDSLSDKDKQYVMNLI